MKSPPRSVTALLAVAVLVCATAAYAQDRLEILERRVEELELQAEESSSGHSGFGDAIHLHGYSELHYNMTSQDGADDELDFHRMAIGLTYEFTDSIVFDMEVDFEHAATELELEFAHVSFLLSEAINFRVGSLLMPVGNLNEFHEPPLFYSVERPYVQKNVIPTTWNEGGAGIFGSPLPQLNYRLYLVGALDASGFTGSSGLRGGRRKVAEAIANDLAAVGRVEYSPCAGLDVGASAYWGNAGQDIEGLDDTAVFVAEGDVRLRKGIFEVAASIVDVSIDDTAELNVLTEEVVGEHILGWYVEGACHVGRKFLSEGRDLVVFVRHEQFDTQHKVATGFDADPANDREVTTAGIAFYPVPNLALKADLESWSNSAGEDWTQSNLGIALSY